MKKAAHWAAFVCSMQTPERFLFHFYHNRIMYKVKFLFFVIEANIVLIITQGHPLFWNAPTLSQTITPLLLYFPRPFALLPLRWPPIALAQIHQPLRFRDLRFHLHDQHLQFLLALLTGVGVDIAGVLFTIGPLGRVAAFEEMVVDLTDAAGAGSALAAHIGLEVGHSRLFRLGRGKFPAPALKVPPAAPPCRCRGQCLQRP